MKGLGRRCMTNTGCRRSPEPLKLLPADDRRLAAATCLLGHPAGEPVHVKDLDPLADLAAINKQLELRLKGIGEVAGKAIFRCAR